VLGAILRKKSATDYDTEFKPLASAQGTPSSNPNVVGAVTKMFGIGGNITPTFSGKVLAMIVTGGIKGAASFASQAQMRYGSGAIPFNGSPAAGTAIGTTMITQNDGSLLGATFCAVITGLTIGTRYWFDLGGNSTDASSTTTVYLPAATLVEIP
jgi:hypothetical protein